MGGSCPWDSSSTTNASAFIQPAPLRPPSWFRFVSHSYWHRGGLDKRVKTGSNPWKTVLDLPHTEEGLSCEEHTVQIEVKGFGEASRTVRVRDGVTEEAAFELEPERALVTIEANAPGAYIESGGGRIELDRPLRVAALREQTLTVKAAKHAPAPITIPALEPGGRWSGTVALEEQRGPPEGEDWTSPSTGMEFVWVDEMNCWVGKYEVTNAEYRKKKPGHDSKDYEGHSLNGPRQPVVYVNFDEAKECAEWLTQRDRDKLGGMRYRVPSEDEWMTFAQCGRGWEYPWGDNWPPKSGQAGNYYGREGAGLWSKISGYNDGHPVTCDVEDSWVNPWGLYGVGGNVWECCAEDKRGSSFGAWRGASWYYVSQDILRCSYRIDCDGSSRGNDRGFRLLLSR
jgi:hypothetical protein